MNDGLNEEELELEELASIKARRNAIYDLHVLGCCLEPIFERRKTDEPTIDKLITVAMQAGHRDCELLARDLLVAPQWVRDAAVLVSGE